MKDDLNLIEASKFLLFIRILGSILINVAQKCSGRIYIRTFEIIRHNLILLSIPLQFDWYISLYLYSSTYQEGK